MNHKPTTEQQAIIDEIQKPECKLLKVEAKSGSGKTSTLVQVADAIKPDNGIYIAFNKHIATEASKKFHKGVKCMTTHSLAYQNTVRQLDLKVGWFNWKTITKKMRYEFKLFVIDTINDFFLSKYTNFTDFVVEEKKHNRDMDNIHRDIYKFSHLYIKEMFTGKIEITHAGYLKMYHMMLAKGKLVHQEFDLIMLDEAQDSAPVVLEIFQLLPAKKKVMVGDPFQSIFKFNKCVNGFIELADEGTSKPMSQTFRCNPQLAEQVESFMQQHADPDFTFVGTEPEDDKIRTVMYISRTNSALVGKIIELMQGGVTFNMARKAKIVFELVLILIHLKPGGKIYSSEWKHLQEDADEWNSDGFLQQEFSSAFKYVSDKYGEEPGIKSAIGVIGTHGRKKILEAYDFAIKHENDKNHKITIGTCHSLKGAEADKVHILDDVNNSIRDLMDSGKELWEYTESDKEKINVVYVAYTRAAKQLTNAEWLEPLSENEL